MEELQCAPSTDAPGVRALKRHLQKVLKRIVSSTPKLKESEIKSKKDVASLENLLEQRDSVVTADNPLTDAMGQDLQARLSVKLSSEIESTVQRLTDELVLMKELYDVTSKAHKEAVGLCRQYHQDLDLYTLSQGLPTIPPLIVMLGWLDSVNHQLKEQYFSRVHYLGSLTDPKVSQSIVSLWNSDIELLNSTLQDIQEQTKYFIKEKI